MELAKIEVMTKIMELIPNEFQPRIITNGVRDIELNAYLSAKSKYHTKKYITILDMDFFENANKLVTYKRKPFSKQQFVSVPIWIAFSREDFIQRIYTYNPQPSQSPLKWHISQTLDDFSFYVYHASRKEYFQVILTIKPDKVNKHVTRANNFPRFKFAEPKKLGKMIAFHHLQRQLNQRAAALLPHPTCTTCIYAENPNITYSIYTCRVYENTPVNYKHSCSKYIKRT